MVRQRSQLSVTGIEYSMKVTPVTENVIHIPSAFGIPAVLCTETADLALKQGLVKLFLQ